MNEMDEVIREDIKEIKGDVKDILKVVYEFRAVTEERLQNGNKRFEDHEGRIRTIEAEPKAQAQEEVKGVRNRVWDFKLLIYGAVIGLVVFLAEKIL